MLACNYELVLMGFIQRAGAVCNAGMCKKLMEATADHEAALTNDNTLTVHTQFPGRVLIHLLTEGIKVGVLLGAGV